MKTELSIIFLRPGLLNKDIANVAALNNEGSNQFLLNDIAGYIICKASEFPFTLGKLKVVVKKNKINVMENGTDQTVILEEKILP